MSGSKIIRAGLTRRALAAALVNAGVLWASWSRAQGSPGEDRGIGGTGVAPADPNDRSGQDRGIGGTGVIGTIRRFGSIEVNDLHVAFSSRVRVTIDGVPASVRDLRLGHVVEALARRRRGLLATAGIAVRSEVVGQIASIDEAGFWILGQHVVSERGDATVPHRIGERVAVSGLRRPDGSIVASLVEPRPCGPAHVRGPLRAGPDGTLTIGTLRVVGLEPKLAGRRVSVVGTLKDHLFHVAAATIEPLVPFAAQTEHLSIEDYVAFSPDGLLLGSGLRVAIGEDVPALPSDGVVRAILTATVDPKGRIVVQSLHVEAERGSIRGRHARARSPDAAHPGLKGPPGGPGPGGPPPGARDADRPSGRSSRGDKR